MGTPDERVAIPSGPPERTPRDARANFIFLLVVAAVTFLVCLLAAGRLWPIGIPGEWTWNYFDRPGNLVGAAAPLFLGALLVGLTAIVLRKGFTRSSEQAAAVVLQMCLAWGMIQVLGSSGPWGVEQPAYVAATGWIGGYYGEAVRESHRRSLGEYLARYDVTISELKVDDRIRGHVADHPAGPVVFHWVVNRVMEKTPGLARWFMPPDGSAGSPGNDERSVDRRAALRARVEELVNLEDDLAYAEDPPDPNRGLTRLVPPVPLSDGAFAGIWASAMLLRGAFWLSLIPLYLLASKMHSPEVGLTAVCLAALTPSLNLFGPYIDQTFPCFATWTCYAWHGAMTKKSPWWAALAAAILFMGLLWSLSLLLLAAMLGLATLLAFWMEYSRGPRTSETRGWMTITVTALATFVGVSLLPWLLLDYHTWRVWRVCLVQHARFAELFNRTYVPWLLFNPIEFLLFAGLPTAAALLTTAGKELRQWWRQRRHAALTPLTWSLVGVLLLANLSGKNLGEVARLWMFLMPFAALVAAPFVIRLDGRRGWFAAGLLGLSLLQTITFRLTLDVFSLDVYFGHLR